MKVRVLDDGRFHIVYERHDKPTRYFGMGTKFIYGGVLYKTTHTESTYNGELHYLVTARKI